MVSAAGNDDSVSASIMGPSNALHSLADIVPVPIAAALAKLRVTRLDDDDDVTDMSSLLGCDDEDDDDDDDDDLDDTDEEEDEEEADAEESEESEDAEEEEEGGNASTIATTWLRTDEFCSRACALSISATLLYTCNVSVICITSYIGKFNSICFFFAVVTVFALARLCH